MATFGSIRKYKKPGSVGYSGIFLVLFANIQFVGEFDVLVQWHSRDDNSLTSVDV